MTGRLLGLARVSTYVGASIASGLVGFAFLPILTRALPAPEFASFSKILLYVQMVSAPLLFGFPAYVTTHVARLNESRNAISTAASDWTRLVLLSAAAMLVAGAATGYLVPVALVLVLAYGRTWQAFAAQGYRLLAMPSRFVVFQVAVPVAFYAVAIVASKFSQFSGEIVFCVASVAYVIAAVHTCLEFRSRGWIGGIVWRRFINDGYVKFAMGAFLHSLAGVAVTSWDKVFVSSRFDARSFADYSVAAQYAAGLILVYSSINQALIPELYVVLDKRGVEVQGYARYLVRLSALFTVVLLGFEVLIGPVIRIMLPAEFQGSIGIARELGLAATLQGVYFVSSSVLFYYHRTLSLSVITMAFGGLGWLMAIGLASASGASVAGISAIVWTLFALAVTGRSFVLVVRNAKKSA